MKKMTILTSILILTLSFSAHGFTKSLRLKGSDTVLPVGQFLAEEYMKTNPRNFISVTGGGSGVGIAALLDGTTDIAMASRAPKGKEFKKAKEKGRALETHVIGFDGIAVIVNNTNPIKKLTIDEIANIYTGKIINWKQLGGEDLNIVVTSRESSSGTFVYFKDHVLKKKDYHSKTLLLPATANIVQTVKSNKAAIGYVGLAYVKKGIKALAVKKSSGKSYVKPSLRTVKDKSYPIARPLFFVTSGNMSRKQKDFLSYVMSKSGQNIVKRIGYIPVK